MSGVRTAVGTRGTKLEWLEPHRRCNRCGWVNSRPALAESSKRNFCSVAVSAAGSPANDALWWVHSMAKSPGV